LVARWSFTSDLLAGGTATVPVELDLFGHLYDTHINPTGIDGENKERYIIAPGISGDFVIDMNYIADVDADVKIAFETLEGSAAVPVEYSVDNGENWVTLNDLANALANKLASASSASEEDAITYVSGDPDTGVATIRIAAVTSNVPILETVKWRWAYDNTATDDWKDLYGNINTTHEEDDDYIVDADAADTALGVASNAAGLTRTKYGIKVTLTATQVLPEPID
jgi:hypothetical protein